MANSVANSNSTSPNATRIGWIGTGVMGTSMCGHLIAAGYGATVTNRTRSKAESLIEKGREVGQHSTRSGREFGCGL